MSALIVPSPATASSTRDFSKSERERVTVSITGMKSSTSTAHVLSIGGEENSRPLEVRLRAPAARTARAGPSLVRRTPS